MAGILCGLPIFIENNMFGGINWIVFKNMVIMVAEVWDAMGYLEEIIKDHFIHIKSADITNSETTSTTTTKLKNYTINTIS